MKKSTSSVFANLGYSFFSNILSLMLSAITVMIVPKVIGVADYGYYQLYIFYVGYTGFFHFGWCDGIYLKYGGIEYDKFNKPLMSSQFWYMTAFESVITLIISVAVLFAVPDLNKQFALFIAVLNIVFLIAKTFFVYILQISNRIKEYSVVLIAEKAVYFVLTIIMLVVGLTSFKPLVIAEIMGKIGALILAMYYCRDMVFIKPTGFKVSVAEAWDNTKIGIKLMVANVASQLILGIVRLCIESRWEIEVYAKVGLAISISNMLLVVINAIGIVLFPILKRTDENKLQEIYSKLRDVMMLLLYALMFVYFPAQVILSRWLPAYSESFTYMSILFPMCIYESKMALLLNTYLKALRKEKELLKANAITVVLSVILSYVSIYIVGSVTLAMVVIVFLFAFRCIFSEIILRRSMPIKILWDNVAEILMSTVFIFASNYFGLLTAFFFYLAAFVCYLVFKGSALKQLKSDVKGIIKSRG